MSRTPRTSLGRLRAAGLLAATASLLGAAGAQTIQQDFDGLAAGSIPAGWKDTENFGFPSFFSAVEVSAAQAVSPPHGLVLYAPPSALSLVWCQVGIPYAQSAGFRFEARLWLDNVISPPSGFDKGRIAIGNSATQAGGAAPLLQFATAAGAIGVKDFAGAAIASLAPSAWHSIAIEFDPAALAVRYDVGGTLKTSAIPAGSPLLAPSNWIDVYLRAGSLFLDDVRIEPLAPPSPWTDLGFGHGGILGIPALAGTGSLVPGSAGTLALGNALPLTTCLWAVSTASVPTPAFGGTLAAAPLAVAVPLPTDLTGSTTLPWTAWPAGFASGSHLYFQVLCPDPSAPPQGVALSNALQASLP